MAELVLVTGGTGYIAGWCIAGLLQRGYDVRATVRGPRREKTVTDAVSAVADPTGRRESLLVRHGGRDRRDDVDRS